MKTLFVLSFFLALTAQAENLTRGEMVKVLTPKTIQVKDGVGKKYTLNLYCLNNTKLTPAQQAQGVEFLTYKTKGKVLIWNQTKAARVMVNGVENLSLKALEWGILPLDPKCTDELAQQAQELGKKRKIGIWDGSK